MNLNGSRIVVILRDQRQHVSAVGAESHYQPNTRSVTFVHSKSIPMYIVQCTRKIRKNAYSIICPKNVPRKLIINAYYQMTSNSNNTIWIPCLNNAYPSHRTRLIMTMRGILGIFVSKFSAHKQVVPRFNII